MRSFRTTIPVSITGWTRACRFSPRHCLTDAELDGSLTPGAAEQIYPMGKRHWRGRRERSEIRGIVIQQNESNPPWDREGCNHLNYFVPTQFGLPTPGHI